MRKLTDPRFKSFTLALGEDGGAFKVPVRTAKATHVLTVIAAYGGGWDHVSASLRHRCPTWYEMEKVKNLFFYPEEVCWQVHPAQSNYVNVSQNCLHIWRKQDYVLPMPPIGFV